MGIPVPAATRSSASLGCRTNGVSQFRHLLEKFGDLVPTRNAWGRQIRYHPAQVSDHESRWERPTLRVGTHSPRVGFGLIPVPTRFEVSPASYLDSMELDDESRH